VLGCPVARGLEGQAAGLIDLIGPSWGFGGSAILCRTVDRLTMRCGPGGCCLKDDGCRSPTGSKRLQLRFRPIDERATAAKRPIPSWQGRSRRAMGSRKRWV